MARIQPFSDTTMVIGSRTTIASSIAARSCSGACENVDTLFKVDYFGKTAYLAQSDVFIGIYWQRYGWIAPTEAVSGLDVARHLLEKGANPDIPLKLRPPYRNYIFDRGGDQVLSTGATPLMRAARNGDWKHVLGSVEAYTVFVHPKDPETVFAGTNDGVWRSSDRGARGRTPDRAARTRARSPPARRPRPRRRGAGDRSHRRGLPGRRGGRRALTGRATMAATEQFRSPPLGRALPSPPLRRPNGCRCRLR